MSPQEQIEFWTLLYNLSPTLFILASFGTFVVYLWRKGLLSPTDPVESRWREEVEERLEANEKATNQLYTKVAYLEGHIEGSKH